MELSNSAEKTDGNYHGPWRFYYAERRRILTRLALLAGGFVLLFLLFAVEVDKHPSLGSTLAVPLIILILLLPAQWFVFMWKIGGWRCPRCGKRFFISTFVNNPLGRRCRHCGLPRLKKSDIEQFHYEQR